VARFELRERIGEGGMGEVHRAFDRTTGAFVAVKTMTARSKVDAAELQRQQRFLQEAELLAQVHHPNVVRHVAHGVDDAGRPFLAMEWLSGVDLDRALENGPLAIADVVSVLHGTAAGLAELHRRGIVHRDVKPANVFLEDGDAARVKLLDLGVAHLQGGARHTRTGALVGTPGYMAPEQARGQAQLTPAADLFSLGALIYECLAGRPAFQSENIPALLAKILFDTPPPVASIRGDVPPALAALVEQLLAKDPTKRPKDACELLESLPELPASALDAPRLSSTQPIGDAERRLTICVFSRAVGPMPATFDAPRTGELPPLDEEISILARRYGAQLSALADGSAVFVFSDAGRVPTEQVRYAVGFARDLHRARGQRAVAVATAFLAVPLGAIESAVAPEAIEKAARLLAFLPDGSEGAPLVLDDLTTNLLDEGARRDAEAPPAELPFVGRQRELAVLRGTFEEVADEQVARTVVIHGVAGIGKSRLVHEFLEGVQKSGEFARIFQVEADPFAPHVPLSLAARLVSTFAGIVATDGAEVRQRKLLELTGETSADAAPVAAAFGAVCGVPFPEAGGWANDAIREKYRDALVVFLHSSRGKAFAHAEGAARRDAMIPPTVIVLEGAVDDASRGLFAYVTKTLPDLPTLLVYVERDDGDGPRSSRKDEGTVLPIPLGPLPPKALERLAAELGGEALTAKDRADAVQESEGNPLLLQELLREQVAVGRRETRTSSETPASLGPRPARLSEFPGERRLGANGRLLAFVTARFQRFDPPARRLLRAASVFGGVAPAAGVRVLTGDDVDGFAERVARLVAAGVLRVVDDTLRIVQATLRDAAYASFPRADRQLAHGLAAGFLARVFEARTPGASERRTDFRGGEAAIAAHWERGGRPDRAALWWVRAARSALFAADPDAAERFVAAALQQIPVVVDESADRAPEALKSTGEGAALPGERVTSAQKNVARAEALVLAAQISAYRGEERERLDRAMDALLAAPRRTDAWFAAAAELSEASYSCSDPLSLHPVAVAVRRGDFDAAESPASLDALLQVSDVLFRFGRAANATALLMHAEVRAPDDPHGRLRFAMRAVGARSERARTERNVVAMLSAFDEGISAATAAADRRAGMQFRIRRAETLAACGRLVEASHTLDECREEAKLLNDRGHALWASLIHGVVLHQLSENTEEKERALALVDQGAAAFASSGNRGGAALAWSLRARANWFRGDAVETLRCARKGRTFTDEGGPTRRTVDALVLLALVATGGAPEAFRLARRLGFLSAEADAQPAPPEDSVGPLSGAASSRRPSNGPISDRNEPLSRLAEAEVLAANGRGAAAMDVVRGELARIEAAATGIPDDQHRRDYLSGVYEHVALRELATRLERKDESNA
jgi:hypothetical protein